VGCDDRADRRTVRLRPVRVAAGPRAHGGFREAVPASLFFIGVALGFGVAFGLIAGWDLGAQYFAGYIVEKSLSVDNLFVFVVILSTFAVPPEHQQRVLTFGILAALAMRVVSSRSARR
jgi:tellurite resistance protein TerC